VEEAFDNLKIDHEKAVLDAGIKYSTIKDLEIQINNLKASKADAFKNFESEINALRDEKKNMQIKCEKVIVENKALKSENPDLAKELKTANSASKSSQKDSKEAFNKYERKLEALQLKLKELNDYRIDKAAEEKSVKNKQKKLEKKEKLLIEREASLKVEKLQFERIKSNLNNTKSFVEVGTFTDENENLVNLETALAGETDGKIEVEVEPKPALEGAADTPAMPEINPILIKKLILSMTALLEAT
jgi:regulator of replication initiation timing